MTKRIIQTDTYSCHACVAAMITGETLQDVVDFCGHDGSKYKEGSTHPDKCSGFGSLEIMKYLLSHRYSIGTWSIFPESLDMEDIDEVRFEIKVSDCPAMIEVNSKRLKGCTHVIYWNGEQIFDPSPDAGDNPPFSEYEILSFMPVIHWEE